ncbi:cytoplasmic protein, partial [Clostridioides difficile]
MNNTIYLRRANKLIIESNEGEQQLPKTYLATALKNIEALGYTFSDELMHATRQLSKEQFEAVYIQLVADL